MKEEKTYHVFGLDRDTEGAFLFMLPEKTETFRKEGRFLLGAVTDEGDPCGVLVYDFTGGVYEMRYLYVLPDHRRNGVGTLLLQKLLWSFYRMGMVFPFWVSYLDADNGEFSAFMHSQPNFIFRTEDQAYLITPDVRRRISHYEKYLNMKSDAVPFFDIDPVIRKHFLQDQHREGYRFLEDFSEQEALLEKDLCFAVCKDEKISSAVFVRRNAYGQLELSYIFAKKMNSLSLRGVLTALLQALEKDHADESIEFQAVNGASEHLADGLFKDVTPVRKEITEAQWDYSLAGPEER